MYSFSRSLRRAALVNPNGIATRFEGRETSWPQALEQVQRFASVLSSAGVSADVRVGILGTNSEAYFQALFAIPWAGGISVPINWRLALPEIIHCLDDAGVKVLLVDDAFAHLVPEILANSPGIEQVISIGQEKAPNTLSLQELLGSAELMQDSGRGGDDIVSLYYTGGTTGKAKGVILTHEAFLVNVLQWAFSVGVGRKDVFLIVAPLFHLVGGLNAVAAAMLGACVCIVRKFDAGELVKEMVRSEVTKAALVPIMIDAIVACLDRQPTDLSTLRRISYGGAPMTETSLQRAIKALPHAQFYQVYGQTEGGPNISVLMPEYHVLEGELAGKLRSAGQPIIGTEIAILDEEGNELPRGEVGEICVTGLTLSPGYWNLPEVTAEAHRHGWLHTGDGGYIDDEGFIFIVDRIKDMIITGGENVYSAEVENVLSQHPAIEQCVVIGIPSERWGEQVHAVVRLREGATVSEAELLTHCRSQLAGYKCIRSVDFRTEPFPVSGANKILKREVREPYWSARKRRV